MTEEQLELEKAACDIIEKRAKRKKLIIDALFWSGIIFMFGFIAMLVIFVPTYSVERAEYIDVNWEWNDDTNSYEFLIWEEDGSAFHFYSIPTEKATIVFVGEEFETYCVIETGKGITGQIQFRQVSKFYINAYYVVKEILEEEK